MLVTHWPTYAIKRTFQPKHSTSLDLHKLRNRYKYSASRRRRRRRSRRRGANRVLDLSQAWLMRSLSRLHGNQHGKLNPKAKSNPKV